MQRQMVWRAVDTVGMEHCTVRVGKGEVVIDGLVLAVVEEAPHRIAYSVACDGAWRACEVVARVLPHGSTLTLCADGFVVTYPGLFTRVWPAINSDAIHD